MILDIATPSGGNIVALPDMSVEAGLYHQFWLYSEHHNAVLSIHGNLVVQLMVRRCAP